MRYFVYNSQTGRTYFEGVGELSDPILEHHQNGAVIGADVSGDFSEYYIDDGVIVARLPMPLITTNTPLIADGIDEVIISGIPSGVQVEWPDGQTDIVTGGEISFSVDLPGTYTFRFTAVLYLDKEITIEAIAAT